VTVVLLHPVGLDGECWSLAGIPGIRHTFPGHGDRPLPPLDEFTLDRFADEVVELYEGPLDLVGVSMGGKTTQHIAARHPERVRSILMCCTSASATAEAARAVIQDERADEMLALGMEGTLESTLRRWFTPAALAARDHPGVRYVTERWLADDPVSVSATWLALRQSGVGESLGTISAPVTVLGGKHDSGTGPEKVAALAAAIPGSRLEFIDGPHMVMLEESAAFAEAVIRHLDWVDGGRAA
jgi:pimeloyl-ACP methyl ester carboxylesterase